MFSLPKNTEMPLTSQGESGELFLGSFRMSQQEVMRGGKSKGLGGHLQGSDEPQKARKQGRQQQGK